MDASDKSGSRESGKSMPSIVITFLIPLLPPCYQSPWTIVKYDISGAKIYCVSPRYALDLTVCLFFITPVDPPTTRLNCTVL